MRRFGLGFVTLMVWLERMSILDPLSDGCGEPVSAWGLGIEGPLCLVALVPVYFGDRSS